MGADLPPGPRRARARGRAGPTAGRRPGHDRRRRPGPDRGAGGRRARRAPRPTSGWTTAASPYALLAAVDRLWHERLVPFEENLRAGRPAPRPRRAVVVAADPTWPAQASGCSPGSAAAPGTGRCGSDHIGSTAVPGLPAEGRPRPAGRGRRPRCGAAGAADDPPRTPGSSGPGGVVGLRRRTRRRRPAPQGDGAERRPRPGGELPRPPEASPAWQARRCTFRDRLRADRVLAAEYADLKRRPAAGPHASIERVRGREAAVRTPGAAPAEIARNECVGAARLPWCHATDDRPPAHRRPVPGRLRLPAERRPAHGHRRARRAGSTRGEQDVVLLGATGTGKSATTAWLIEQVQRPDAGAGPEQDARRAARQRVPRAAAAQRGRVLRLLLRLLPARGVHPADRHLHREGLLDQRGGRAAAALGDELAADPARRRRGRLGLVHLRPGHPAGVRRPDGPAQGRHTDRARRAAAPVRPDAVHPQRPRLHPRHVPGARRHGRDHPGVRGAGAPDRVLRRRDRPDLHPAPADRRDRPRGGGDVRLPGDALRRRPGADGARDRAASRPSWPTGSPSSSGRASCSRRSGCGCARPTTSR